MKAIFQQHKNPLGINGVPVEVKQIIDTQAVVVLPNGKKTFLEVLHLKSFCGEISFNGETSAELVPDAEAPAATEPQPAPLFEAASQPENTEAEEAAASEDNPAKPKKGSK